MTMKKITATEQLLVEQTINELINEIESDPSITQAHGLAFYIGLNGVRGQVQIIITNDTSSFLKDTITVLTLKKL